MSTSIVDNGHDRVQLIKLMLITSLSSLVFRSLIVVAFSDVMFITSTLKYFVKILITSSAYGVLVSWCWRYKSVRAINQNNQVNTEDYAEKNTNESMDSTVDSLPQLSDDNDQNFENVSWIRACGNYVELFTPDSKFIKRKPIRELANQLINVGLVQVHRSFLVNKDLIIRLHPKANGAADLELNCGQRIPVSKRYIAEIKAILANKSQSA